jgi:hypothetical protein
MERYRSSSDWSRWTYFLLLKCSTTSLVRLSVLAIRCSLVLTQILTASYKSARGTFGFGIISMNWPEKSRSRFSYTTSRPLLWYTSQKYFMIFSTTLILIGDNTVSIKDSWLGRKEDFARPDELWPVRSLRVSKILFSGQIIIKSVGVDMMLSEDRLHKINPSSVHGVESSRWDFAGIKCIPYHEQIAQQYPQGTRQLSELVLLAW